MNNRRISFLRGFWEDLVFLTFSTTSDVLQPYLPKGLQLDLFNGTPLLSLVAFRFRETRIFGFRAPCFHSFAELNLRFYVREANGPNRGVVFIREVCPYRPVALTARLLYNERFTIARCDAARNDNKTFYSFRPRQSSPSISGSFVIRSHPNGYLPPDGSLSHFISDRYHGYSRLFAHYTLHYDVQHPPWRVYDSTIEELSLDLNYFYGPQLSYSLSQPPISILFSPGSEIDLSLGKPLWKQQPHTSSSWAAGSAGLPQLKNLGKLDFLLR